MCMEDIRIARKTRSFETRITVPSANSIVIAPANPKRITIVFTQPSANRINVSIDQDATVLTGYRIVSQSEPVSLFLQTHGELVTRKFTAISTTADQSVSVFETVLEDE